MIQHCKRPRSAITFELHYVLERFDPMSLRSKLQMILTSGALVDVMSALVKLQRVFAYIRHVLTRRLTANQLRGAGTRLLCYFHNEKYRQQNTSSASVLAMHDAASNTERFGG